MKINSIKFLIITIAACAGSYGIAATPPYKGIYSNDTTNLLTCVSPYHPDGDKVVTDAMIRASVAEAAVPGIEAQILQPGMGSVPWWPSKVAPLDEQEAWFREHFGVEPENEYHDYLRQGGDLVGTFLDECKKQGVAGIISLRLNDAHHLEYAWGENGVKPRGWMVQSISKFYGTHPQWVLPLRPGATAMTGRGLNWLFDEPRQYKLALIKELLNNYDLDAIELDFMRFPYYFPDDTPYEKRVEVMQCFIRDVRAALDERNAKDGKKRWLLARVPAYKRERARIGFDPKAFAQAGIDVFNASANYCTNQQTELEEIRTAAPDTPIYYELTHTAQVRPIVKEYDGFIYRRNTKEMLETTARLAYLRGADAISVFNFPYYREHGPSRQARGPFNEPPFEYLSSAADRESILKNQPAYFFYAVSDNHDIPVQAKKTQYYTMDMAPPTDERARKNAILRIMVVTESEKLAAEGTPAQADADRGKWEITLNDRVLNSIKTDAGAYPYPTPIKAGFGQKEQYLAFAVPPGIVVDGENEVSATLLEPTKQTVSIRWIELYYPN